jgi:hypothetical protein
LSDRGWRWIGALALAVVIVGALPSMPRRVQDWDNIVKLHVAENWLGGRGPMVTVPTPDDALYIYRARDGRAFSSYPPAAIAFHFLTLGAERLGAKRSEGIPMLAVLGCLAWILIAWGRRSGASPPAAVAGAMLVCLGTMLWPMAAFGYQNLVDTFALAVILWAGAGSMDARDWFWAGAAVGLACLTRFGSGVLAAPALLLLLGPYPWNGARLARRAAAFVL